jgi:hypothetical protein
MHNPVKTPVFILKNVGLCILCLIAKQNILFIELSVIADSSPSTRPSDIMAHSL